MPEGYPGGCLKGCLGRCRDAHQGDAHQGDARVSAAILRRMQECPGRCSVAWGNAQRMQKSSMPTSMQGCPSGQRDACLGRGMPVWAEGCPGEPDLVEQSKLSPASKLCQDPALAAPMPEAGLAAEEVPAARCQGMASQQGRWSRTRTTQQQQQRPGELLLIGRLTQGW